MIRGTEVDFALAIAKHEGMVAVHADGIGVAAFIAGGRTTASSVELMAFDVDPARARQIIKKLKSDTVEFVELPPFEVTADVTGDRVFDIAPALYALWYEGCGDVFDYLCVHIPNGDIGLATCAVQAFLDAENGEEIDVECEQGYAESDAFEEWIRQLSASEVRRVQDFGLGLGNTLVHFDNHDLEGNELDEDGEPIDPDNRSEIDEDEELVGGPRFG